MSIFKIVTAYLIEQLEALSSKLEEKNYYQKRSYESDYK